MKSNFTKKNHQNTTQKRLKIYKIITTQKEWLVIF